MCRRCRRSVDAPRATIAMPKLPSSGQYPTFVPPAPSPPPSLCRHRYRCIASFFVENRFNPSSRDGSSSLGWGELLRNTLHWRLKARHHGILNPLRATSHMRLSACDHDNSSTLIGGKDRPGPSSLRTTLEGSTEYVNARWM